MVRKILSFDIGGTHMRAAIVEGNKIKKLLRANTPKDKRKFVKQLHELADELYSKDIRGIGVSIAGVIKNGVVKTSPNLPIRNFNIKKNLESRYKKKVEVFNDAGCFALAEYKFGTKKKDFIILTLGTGIGGGIMIDGKPYSGGTGLGGELGHMYLQGRDFESLWKHTRSRIKKEFMRDVLMKDLVNMNYPKAKRIVEEAADYLGKGVASLISIFDPEVVILAGGPKDSGEKFMKPIQKNVDKYKFLPRKVPVKWTKLKEPGILGACLLI